MTKNFPQPNSKKSIDAAEKEILKFWKDNQIFKKTLETRNPRNKFNFFDGPPFATGTPHYGHILAGTIKDAIPRYKTMCGYHIPRKWGWDCHGVPVEFQVEKEHKIGGKPGIEKMGVGKFNELCRSVVMCCADDWEKTVERMGRFVDFKDDYRTMDPEYMESVWWVFAKLWDKGLIYEGEKVIAYSPKLGSPLSNFEANLNYKPISDPAVTVKFRLIPESGLKTKIFEKQSPDSELFFLAWTTTPWTLLSNLALCVNEKLEYVVVEKDGENYIVGKNLAEKIFGENCKITKNFAGSSVIGLKYEPLFPFFKNHENAFQILSDDFVSDSDGTGIVHMAPNFGEEDARVCQLNDVKYLSPNPIDENGYFDETIPKLNGLYFRDDAEVANSREKNVNKWVLENLGDKIFKKESVTHDYPFCWRTDCALMYRGVKTWFVNVQKIKAQMIEKNQDINWAPEHLKNGRFGKTLETAPDWAISRNRFWGTPIPVWRCEQCENIEVVNSREILENKCGKSVDDLHKHFVDDLTWDCGKCAKKMEITFIRHGQTDNNVAKKFQGSQNIPLNDKGRNQAKSAKQNLAKFDIVISSPLDRSMETAKILFPNAEIIIDKKIREKNHGDLEGMTPEEVLKKYPQFKDKGDIRYGDAPNGDSFENDLKPRVREFIKDILKKYPSKKVAVITHQTTIRALYEVVGLGSLRGKKIPNLHSFSATLDFPPDKGGLRGVVKRIPEVLDCWFESGSMPYASIHYPFEKDQNLAEFASADFIAEGLDQTRGWFYTLHVLGCALFEKNIFKNVITNGIILAEDGQKMSKSKKNYPDPNLVFEKYGADAMRFYLLNSPVVRGENFRFAENGVAEVLKQVILPLKSSYQFFATYANIDNWKPTKLQFLRHGEGDHNVQGIYSGKVENDHHLTEKGKKQVQNSAKKLEKFDVLISSPFIRALETAEIVKNAKKFKDEIIIDDRVRETGFGNFEGTGTKIEDCGMRFFNPKFKDGETIPEVEKRMHDFFNEISRDFRGKTITVCGHGDSFRQSEMVTNSIPTNPEEWKLIPMPGTAGHKLFFPPPQTDNELDKWILSELQVLVGNFRENFDAYDLESGLKIIPKFIDKLNNWYLRRSRERFWASGMSDDKISGYETLFQVLLTFSKILAPVCPFFAEELFKNLTNGESVHLEMMPFANKKLVDNKLNKKIEISREIVRLAAFIRGNKKIKLRQPLAKLQFAIETSEDISLSAEDLAVIKSEANVHEVEIISREILEKYAKRIVKVQAKKVGPRLGKKVQELIIKGKNGDFKSRENGEIEIAGEILTNEEYAFGFLTAEGVEAEATSETVVLLDTEITEELKIEGFSREIIRLIQDLRKSSGFEISDRIKVKYFTESEKLKTAFAKFREKIASETLATEIIENSSLSADEVEVGGKKCVLKLEKV